MTIGSKDWKKILSPIDADGSDQDNVIEKIQKRLKEYPDEYKNWNEAKFNVNHLFHVVDKSDNSSLGNYEYKYTLLHLAAFHDLENLAYALSKVEGVDVQQVEEESLWTPLHSAARFNSTKVIDVLLQLDGINVNAQSCSKCTPLHLAAHYNCAEAIEALLKSEKVDVNATDKDNSTPLHAAILSYCDEGVLKRLIEAKANVNALDKDKNTPLHIAVKKHNVAAVKTLTENGVDVNVKDKDGKTPFSFAIGEARDILIVAGNKQATEKSLFVGCSTAVLSAAAAYTFFATCIFVVNLLSISSAVAIVATTTLVAGYITYEMFRPSTKV